MKLLKRLLLIGVVYLALMAISCGCAKPEEVSVGLSLSPQEVRAGEQFEVKVQVEPGKQGVSAVEIKLSFNPEVMQVVGVKRGTLLGERPLPGISVIDNEAGILSYSLARIGETRAPTSAADLAVVTFQVLNSAQPGNYELGLISVGLANENFEDVPDIKIKVASIRIGM